MIGQCNKACENKTEFGYCKSTVCSNQGYNGVSNVGINETIVFVPMDWQYTSQNPNEVAKE